MNEHDASILALLGFAMAWFRQFKWFNDGLTLLAAILGAALMVAVNHMPELLTQGGGWTLFAAFIRETIEHTPSVLGGTMVAHFAAQKTALVPKWNSAKGGS